MFFSYDLKDVSTSASFLLDKRIKAAWDEMSDDNRYSNVDAIMSSVENAGQVMSQYLAGDLSSQSKVKGWLTTTSVGYKHFVACILTINFSFYILIL